MKKIAGTAAFGLGDSVALPEGGCAEIGFFLGDAVTPQNPLGAIRTGKAVEYERTHSGLNWPRESQIAPGKPLRRVPVPCAWSLFVEAEDTPARWASVNGGTFPLAAILAEHVRTLLVDTGKGAYEADEVIVAIPDHLDEYGQEALLRELRHRVQAPTRLLWRPVAAALEWLDQTAFDLGTIADGDWLAVLYFGADGIECTGFRLQTSYHGGVCYILPIRERPAEPPGPSGIDWAVDAMENLLGLGMEDPGAFWQAFTVFPEVWQALAGRSWESSALPRPWSKGGSWEQWSPPSTLAGELSGVPVRGGTSLWRLLEASSPLQHNVHRGIGKAWGGFLKEEVTRLVSRMGKRGLVGAVVCGPLAPRTQVPWLESLGLRAVAVPKPGTLWLAAESDDPIASGARLYGQRLALGLPTYRDTLPQIATLAIAQGEYQWVDLVEATTCEGGQPYTRELYGQFQLRRGCDWVEVYLKRVLQEKRPPEEMVPTPDLPEQGLASAREKIRSFNSLEEVRAYRGWDVHPKLKAYALQFAEAHFSQVVPTRTPYRKGKMLFPSAPEQDTVLDLKVEMRPASGLAQVEFIPRQREFLKGRRVFFDYSRMEDIQGLPVLKRGWPEIVDMPLTNDPTVLVGQYVIQNFLSTTVHYTGYIKVLNNAKQYLSSGVSEWRANRLVWLKKINQDGQAGSSEGQRIVAAIREKIAEHFRQLIEIGNSEKLEKVLEKVVIRGSWLWGSTPRDISKYLEEYFKEDFTNYPARWNYFVEAASRCFIKERQFALLYTSIHKRIQHAEKNKPFPIESARAVYRILMYRNNAQDALREDQARTFLEQSLRMIDDELIQRNIKQKFFQGVLLFFVLLRFRKVNPKFMNPDERRYEGIFKQITEYLEYAKASVRETRPTAADRISDLLDSIMAYVRFEGIPGIIQLLAQEADKGDE